MSFTYSGDPSSSDLDEVRFHVQDTDSADPLLSDEELQFLIDRWLPVVGSNVWAAAMAAETIAAKFAREVSVSADGVSVGVQDLQTKYDSLALSLRDAYKTLAGTGGAPSAGGTLWDDLPDGTIKPLSFAKGMHDTLRAGSQDLGTANGLRPEYPDVVYGA